MFPTQSDGLSIDLERSIFEPLFENPLILDDLNADYAALDGNEASDNGVKKRQRMSSSVTQIYKNNDDDVSKKTMHRDIERQRRQEMANLYASLRSLLPLEYVKGKRAVSDHMHEAVNYIKDIQRNIDEMKIRRDRLRKLRGLPGGAGVDSEDVYFVKVNPCRGAIEVLIGSSVNEESFPLSKVLMDLFGRGLNVITCVSTRGHQCSLHKLEIELNETTSVDLSELQDRLVNLIKLA